MANYLKYVTITAVTFTVYIIVKRSSQSLDVGLKVIFENSFRKRFAQWLEICIILGTNVL